MDLELVFLGTGARQPTPARGASALMAVRGPDHVLVDCGEGTQERLLRSRPGLRHLRAILVTHCHGDHLLGLPGLLATVSDARTEPLTIAGPPGLREVVDGFARWFGRLAFPLTVREMAPADGLTVRGWHLIAVPARHGVPALAWALVEESMPGHLDHDAAMALGVPDGPLMAQLAGGRAVRTPAGDLVEPGRVVGPPRPGRRIVVSGDTEPTAEVEAAAAGADLLVHEATFLERDAGLARQTRHSTAAQAAGLAARAGVRALALTHSSQRYRPAEVLAEARATFPGAVLPDDLDLMRVPLPERGSARLVAGGGRSGA